MKKTIFITMLISFVVTCCAYADLPQPRLTPKQGQTKEQLNKDMRECEEIAIKASSVDPVALNMQYRGLESMYSMKTMPAPGHASARGDLQTTTVLSPSRNSEVQDYRKRMTEIEKEYKKYKNAFTAEIKGRGYEVKWK